MSTANRPEDRRSRFQRSRYGQLVAAFTHGDFRVLWVATLPNQLGMGMQQVLLGWLVFNMTGSGTMVGVVFAARSAPNLVVGFTAGSIADRVDRRALMRWAAFGTMLASVGVAALLYADRLQIWHLMVATLLLGGLLAFYLVARQAYIYDLVGPSGAVNGIGLISLAQQVGGVFGALLAGGIIHWWGPGTCFLVMGVVYGLGAFVLFGLQSRGQAAPQFPDPIWENVLSYLGALKTNRVMLNLMITTAMAETLGFSHGVILPILAEDVLHVGATGLGVLTAFRFLGGTLGIMAVTALWQLRHHGILLLAVLLLFGVGQVMLSQSPSFWFAVLFVTFINVMASAIDILHNTLLQLSVPNEQRGRAMGSWIVGIGTSPGGQLEAGYLAEAAGSRVALLANGVGLAAMALFLGAVLPRLRRL